jgi:fructose-specific phosphotransferase system IIC component
LLIPNAVTNLLFYVIAIVTGALVTTGALFFLKRPITGQQEQELTASTTEPATA